MRLILIRHGHPNYEKDCLTALGQCQAEAAAERLAGERIEAIYTSPMGRARETAEATAHRLGFTEMETLPFMHELYWGTRDGSQMFANGNPWYVAFEMIRMGSSLMDPNWGTKYPMFACNRVTEEVLEKGIMFDQWLETQGYRREGLYYKNIQESDRQRTIALFAHGGSLSAVISRMLNIPFPMVCGFLHLDFTSITIFNFDNQPGSISLPDMEIANDWRHIVGVFPKDEPQS